MNAKLQITFSHVWDEKPVVGPDVPQSLFLEYALCAHASDSFLPLVQVMLSD